MKRKKRNIGMEILQGLRELKRGEHDRVINVPAVGPIEKEPVGKREQAGYYGGKGDRTMSEAVAQIAAQLGGLSQQERAELAQLVLSSLEPEDPGASEAWDQELVRRVARIRAGEAVGIPAEQVFADWRRGRT